MAKQKKAKSRGDKLSRFHLGRQTELALAAAGLIFVVVAAVFFGWMAISKYYFKPDPSEVAAEQALKAQQDSRWEALLRDGTILRVDEARKDLFVDPIRWDEIGLSGQTEAAILATGHFGWKHCLVYDASTGTQLGWYKEPEGYKKVGKG
jgi:hypothetical protein